MPKYRKKPVEIEAIQWLEFQTLISDVLHCFEGLKGMGASSVRKQRGKLIINTHKRELTVHHGQWIIREDGELRIIEPDIFEWRYERVGADA